MDSQGDALYHILMQLSFMGQWNNMYQRQFLQVDQFLNRILMGDQLAMLIFKDVSFFPHFV